MQKATGARVLEGEFVESGIYDAPVRPKTLAPDVRLAELPPEIQTIIVGVAEAFCVPVRDLLARDRHKSVAAARHVVQWVVRRRWPEKSYPELGRMFGRDHSTVVTAVQKIDVEVSLRTPVGVIALAFYDPMRLQLVAGEGLMLLGEGA